MIQEISTLGFLNETPKGWRGLTGNAGLVGLAGAFVNLAGLALNFDGVKLTPGGEDPVAVAVPKMPPSADIKRLTATINIQPDETAKPTAIRQGSTIVEEGEEAKSYQVEISQPALPRNISVRLDGGEVFWSLGGAQAQGEHKLPDFTAQANIYLDKLPPGSEEVIFKFLVAADGPGEVRIEIAELEYSVIQTQAWKNPLDETIRLDRNLQLDFGGVERIPLDPFTGSVKEPLSLFSIRADLGGEFEPARLFGGFTPHQGGEFATISSDFALAQGLAFSADLSAKPLQCIGVTGAIQVVAEAELYLEIQPDAGGAPASSAPLARSNLTLVPEPGATSPTERWLFARFDAPVDLHPGIVYWIVIKGVRGKALLAVQTQPETYLQTALVNRGGQLWKNLSSTPAPPIAALLRLVYLPGIDNQSAAIEIAVEGTPVSQRLDPGPEAQTMSLNLPPGTGEGEAVVTIKSRARGSLSIANVIQEYAPKSTPTGKPGGKNTLFKFHAAAAQLLKK